MIQADGRAVFPSALKNSFGNGVNTKCFLVCFHISGKFLVFLTQGKVESLPFVYEWYMCGSIGMCKTLLNDVTHRSPLVRRFSSLPTFFSPGPWFQAGKELNKKWSECLADSLGPNFSHCQGAAQSTLYSTPNLLWIADILLGSPIRLLLNESGLENLLFYLLSAWSPPPSALTQCGGGEREKQPSSKTKIISWWTLGNLADIESFV